MRGLRTKLSITRSSLPLYDFDIFAFSESNLTSSHLSSEIGFTNFEVFRCDRDLQNTSKKSGGGVLLAVHNRLSATCISRSSQLHFEQLFVRILTTDRSTSNKFILCVVYIPPSSPPDTFSCHFDEVERLHLLYPDHSFVLIGDYNLPELSWVDDDTLPVGSSPRSCEFLDRISFLDLSQFNFIRNVDDRTLDLVLSTLPDGCNVEGEDSFLPIDSPHPPLCITLPVNPFETLSEDFFGYNFRRGPYSFLNNLFWEFDWITYLKSDNVETNVDLFTVFISNVIQVFVPSLHVKKSTYPHWYSPLLKTLIIKKKCAHGFYKSLPSSQSYSIFSELRALCKAESIRCYSSYISTVTRNIKDDPRYFWRYHKNLRNDSGIPKVVKFNGIESSSPLSSANLFACHFLLHLLTFPLAPMNSSNILLTISRIVQFPLKMSQRG